MTYRNLTEDEVLRLKSQSCLADDWGNVLVAEGFNCEYVHHTRFHNVTVGDNCCIENIQNYIANYEIGHDTFIENVDIIFGRRIVTFGNGVEATVLNETGGREVLINDKLSAHQAYILGAVPSPSGTD